MITLPNALRPALTAIAALLPAACDSAEVSFNGVSGVPLDRLVTAGARVHAVELSGPDSVKVVSGPVFAIKVAGDTAGALRFVLHDGTLGIGRKGPGPGTATVTVTVPALDAVSLAGSGSVAAERIGGAAAVTLGGSGRVELGAIDATTLAIAIAGSGSVTGAGHAGHVDLAITGSGDAQLAALVADTAALDLTGSGGGALASKGSVTGSLTGSGHFTVRGTTRCTVETTGSGAIACLP